MSDQTNPPRPRSAGIDDILELQIMGQPVTDKALQKVLQHEYARGRAEPLAELRAGAEPTYQVWVSVGGLGYWLDTTCKEYEMHDLENSKRVLFRTLPVPGEAELAAEVERLRNALKALFDWADLQWCPHEETHHAGFLWTICDQCGGKWADDAGGMPSNPEPDAVKRARAALAAAPETQG